MTSEQFCYWLQGFGELTSDQPSPEQWASIKEHLQTTFNKVTSGSIGGRAAQCSPLAPLQLTC